MKLLSPLRWIHLSLLLTTLSGAILLLLPPSRLDTDILALLPSIHRDPAAEIALKAQTRVAADKVLVVARSPKSTDAEREATRIAEEMRACGVFTRVDARVTVEDLKPLAAFFFAHPFQLTDGDGRASSGTQVTKEARARAFAPDGIQWLQSINSDPLLLFPVYLRSLFSSTDKVTLSNGFIHRDTPNSRNVLIVGHAEGAGYSRLAQQAIIACLDRLSVEPPSSLLTSGIVFFANESATRTESEVKTLSTVTMVAVVALLLVTFRSISVVLTISAFIATAFMGALFITNAFTEGLHDHPIHLLTLGFGSCLIGVSVDYAIHFFVAHRLWRGEAGGSPERRIFSGIILGFLTTALGFIGIALSPFPGLQQLAMFCVAGLLLAVLTTLILLPWFAGPPRFDLTLESIAGKSRRLFSPFSTKLVGLALIPLLLAGLPLLRANDDIRTLNEPSQQLLARQREVAELMGVGDGGTAIVIEGTSTEEALSREEIVTERLRRLRLEGKLSGYRALSEFVPSQARQRAMYGSLAEAFATSPDSFTSYATDMRLRPEAITRLNTLSKSEPSDYALPSECLSRGACRLVEDLWHTLPTGSVVSTIALEGCRVDPAEIIAGVPGARAIHQADAISRALQLYRHAATNSVALFYFAVYLLITLRYGVRHSWRVIAPALCGGAAALASLGLAGIPLNVFSVFALIVLLGVGIDYAIFFAEDKEQTDATRLAVALSTFTTIISFGALSFSSTPALRGFGIVLSIGVIFAALLAPLAQRGAQER